MLSVKKTKGTKCLQLFSVPITCEQFCSTSRSRRNIIEIYLVTASGFYPQTSKAIPLRSDETPDQLSELAR